MSVLARGHAPSRLHRRSFWPAVVAGAYLTFAVLVTLIEYASEVAKIGRGTYTDTFSPYVFTELLTLPMSRWNSHPVAYPTQFDGPVFDHLVRQALGPTVVNIVAETAAIAAVVLLGGWVRRFRSAR